MSMLIFFSYLVGLLMKEWKTVSRKTYTRLVVALFTLIISFIIMTAGTMKSEKAQPSQADTPTISVSYNELADSLF